MKIQTVLMKRGLTLPQYRALAAARKVPLVRVAGGWRWRGASDRMQPIVVDALAAKGCVVLAEAGTRAIITEAGRRLLVDVEGR